MSKQKKLADITKQKIESRVEGLRSSGMIIREVIEQDNGKYTIIYQEPHDEPLLGIIEKKSNIKIEEDNFNINPSIGGSRDYE